MKKRLTRSREHKVLGGVCGGLADYFDIDPVITRLAYILITVASHGFGILVYIIAWIIVPLEEGGASGKKEPIHVEVKVVKEDEGESKEKASDAKEEEGGV